MSYFVIPSEGAIVEFCRPDDESAFLSQLRLFCRRGGIVHGSSNSGFDGRLAALTFWMEGEPTCVWRGNADVASDTMRRGIAESLEVFHEDQMRLAEFV